MKLTDEELKSIRGAVEAATSGPWEVMNNRDVFTHKGATSRTGIKADDNDGWHIADTMCGPTSVSGEDWELSYVERYANAHLIANAPTWLIAQLDHIDVITAEYNEELNRLSAERDIDSTLIIDLGKRLKEANEKIKRLEEQFNVKS